MSQIENGFSCSSTSFPAFILLVLCSIHTREIQDPLCYHFLILNKHLFSETTGSLYVVIHIYISIYITTHIHTYTYIIGIWLFISPFYFYSEVLVIFLQTPSNDFLVFLLEVFLHAWCYLIVSLSCHAVSKILLLRFKDDISMKINIFSCGHSLDTLLDKPLVQYIGQREQSQPALQLSEDLITVRSELW